MTSLYCADKIPGDNLNTNILLQQERHAKLLINNKIGNSKSEKTDDDPNKDKVLKWRQMMEKNSDHTENSHWKKINDLTPSLSISSPCSMIFLLGFYSLMCELVRFLYFYIIINI